MVQGLTGIETVWNENHKYLLVTALFEPHRPAGHHYIFRLIAESEGQLGSADDGEIFMLNGAL